MFSSTSRLLGVLAATVLASGGCGDTTTPSTTGILEVTTTTSGDPPPAGYRIELDTLLTEEIAATDNRRLTQITPGDHVVILRSVPLNCIVTSANPQYVTVDAGETSTAAFAIACDAPSAAPPDLVFEMDGADGDESVGIELYAIQIDGTGLRKLTSTGTESGPQWTTDGGRIDFRSETGGPGGTPALFSMLPDGSDRRLTKSGLRGDLQTWSPNRSRFLLSWVQPGLDDQLPNLYVTDSAETQLARVSRATGAANPYFATPSWSPDGRLVAFDILDRRLSGGGPAQVFVADPGVTEPVRQAFGGHPAWSPDGQRLAYVHNPGKPTGVNIHLLTVGSTELPIPVTHEAMDTLEWRYMNPVWSPDGQWLVAGRTPPLSHPNPTRQLVAMRTDGTDIRVLRKFAASPFDDRLPSIGRIAWRPTGGSP